jgi:hypothetical protein
MKYIAIILLSILAIGCASKEQTFLEGEWRSNKKLTVANYTNNPELTSKKKDFLNRELGKLTLVFKGNKIRQYWYGDSSTDIEWKNFEIKDISGNRFTIEFRVGFFQTVEAEYILENQCIYQAKLMSGFREYFCKL